MFIAELMLLYTSSFMVGEDPWLSKKLGKTNVVAVKANLKRIYTQVNGPAT